MTLVVEDGSGKPDAQSYASEADVRAYAVARGVTLPADDAALDVMIVKSMDYLESFGDQFQGVQSFPSVQALQWPRRDDEYSESVAAPLPKTLVAALCQCVMEVNGGTDLQPNVTTDPKVHSEKVDVIETVYMTAQEMGSTGFFQSLPKVNALLAGLLAGGAALKAVRV